MDFVLEGGSIESDGKGTIFTTTCCLMAPHRNQPLTQSEIEVRLKEYLGKGRTELDLLYQKTLDILFTDLILLQEILAACELINESFPVGLTVASPIWKVV